MQDKVTKKISEIYKEMLKHDGFSEFRVEMRLLKRGQKEVIIYYGKQYRFVVDFYNKGEMVEHA